MRHNELYFASQLSLIILAWGAIDVFAQTSDVSGTTGSAGKDQPEEAAPLTDGVLADDIQDQVKTALQAAEDAKKEAAEARAAAEAMAKELEALKKDAKAKKKSKKKKKSKYKGALGKKPKLKTSARIYSLWELDFEEENPGNEFSISMARVELTWSQWKLVEAEIDVDVAHLLEDASDFSMLRDLYVHIQPLSWLGIRMGQFKRPFSRVELTSRGKLCVIHRGMSNDWIIDSMGYGGRDIGLQVEGRLIDEIKLDYAVAVMNGAGMNLYEQGLKGLKDFTLRLDMRPVRWLSFGMSASFKSIEKEDLQLYADPGNFSLVDQAEYPMGYTMEDFVEEHDWMIGTDWMTEADVKMRFGDMRILIENMFGKNWWFSWPDFRYTWSVLVMLSYKATLSKDWKIFIEPVAKVDFVELLPRAGQWSRCAWQIVPGVNLHLGKHVRVMINGEFMITTGKEPDETTRQGLWPGEWPGAWEKSPRILMQLAFRI